MLNNDRIGKLRLRRGPYRITLLSERLSCRAAARLFRGFLQDFEGALPRPWVLNVQTATFSRGRSQQSRIPRQTRPLTGATARREGHTA